jgi:hypothetical protein
MPSPIESPGAFVEIGYHPGNGGDGKGTDAVTTEDIELRQVLPSPSAPDGLVPIAYSVSLAGTALYLFVEEGIEHEMSSTTAGPDQPFFPKAMMEWPYRAEVVEASPKGATSTALVGLDVANPMIELLPSGELVVIGPRANRYRDGTTDLNCLVFSREGHLLRRFTVGDGIKDGFSDNHGRIWIAYFDEGIFGNLGWGDQEGPAPIGESGLNCFDGSGKKLWDFGLAGGEDLISDCYAMNVAGADTWIYFYAEFPLYRITEEFQAREWKIGLKGCGAFAVSDGNILFSGQYNDGPETVYLAEWGDDTIGRFKKSRLVKPNGRPIDEGRLICRGPTVNYFDESGWFQYIL